MKEVGRNDPCPCGSGKKYKKCCMQKSSTKERTYTQVQSMNTGASIKKITNVLSQSLRETHPKAADKMDSLVKKIGERNKEDVDPKS